MLLLGKAMIIISWQGRQNTLLYPQLPTIRTRNMHLDPTPPLQLLMEGRQNILLYRQLPTKRPPKMHSDPTPPPRQ